MWKNITDYGAVCDGVTDDTLAWNSAISAVNAGLVSALTIPGLSAVSAALPTITKKIALTGAGRRVSGLVFTGGGDVTFLNILLSNVQDEVTISNLSLLTTQVNLGQALKIKIDPDRPWDAEPTIHLTNVEVSGVAINQNGFKRGIELVNVWNSVVEHYVFQGWKNEALPGPTQWLQADWAIKHYAQVGGAGFAASCGVYFNACQVSYAQTGYTCPSGNLQGVVFTDCAFAFNNTGWVVTPDSDHLLPYWAWNDCQWEGYNQAIKVNNASYISIDNCQFYNDAPATPQSDQMIVEIDNSYSTTITHNRFISGQYANTATHAIWLANSNVTDVTGNIIQGISGTGVSLRGTTDNTRYHDNHFVYPYAGTIEYDDQSSGANNVRKGGYTNPSVATSPGTATTNGSTWPTWAATLTLNNLSLNDKFSFTVNAYMTPSIDTLINVQLCGVSGTYILWGGMTSAGVCQYYKGGGMQTIAFTVEGYVVTKPPGGSTVIGLNINTGAGTVTIPAYGASLSARRL